MRARTTQLRPAATSIEFAVIGPTTFLLLIGLLVGGMGASRYQQVSHLAREGARWASVHGTDYATDTGKAAATASDVYTNAILPYAVGLDTTKLGYTVTWTTSNSPSHTATVSGQQVDVANTVTVTVTYSWIPEA